jgi:hypothetical protein
MQAAACISLFSSSTSHQPLVVPYKIININTAAKNLNVINA